MSTGSDDIIQSYRVEIRDPGPAAAVADGESVIAAAMGSAGTAFQAGEAWRTRIAARHHGGIYPELS